MAIRKTGKTLTGRNLVSIFDLADGEIQSLFDLADEMGKGKGRNSLCADRILATLFYEPSTRTRFSFEAAMLRLGGGVISCADARSSSVAKGETLADTVRILSAYADIVVIRHPLEGSARVAADYAKIPVINAGDGPHEHPTQTLLDLYTIRREKGRIAGVKVALVGDLKHGRTAHSLAYGLARFGGKITCVAPEGLEMPADILARLARDYNLQPEFYHSLGDFISGPGQFAPRGDKLVLTEEVLRQIDVIYVTRVQKERFNSPEEFEAAKGSYAVTLDLLRRARPDTLIMHPLPRVDELSYEIDADPRAAYFRQAAYGLPVRMALLAAVLGKHKIKAEIGATALKAVDLTTAGMRCPNRRCITQSENYLRAKFLPVADAPDQATCYYCDQEVTVNVSLE
jgi:aspartate carbamoyltransferase catalytic subunit